MIMMGDKKNMVAGIMSKLKDGPKTESEKPRIPVSDDESSIEASDDVVEDDSIGMDTAAEELMAAIEAKSPKMIVEAFKSMMAMYESSEQDEE